jgi:membrane associated rhomboid family serine protease
VLQLVSAIVTTQDDVQVAWFAHIGGFLTGLILTFGLRSRLLVGRPSRRAFAAQREEE